VIVYKNRKCQSLAIYLSLFHFPISIAIMFSAAVWLTILTVASASHPPSPTAAPQYSGHSQNSWINYTAVPGFFLQDDSATVPSTFDYVRNSPFLRRPSKLPADHMSRHNGILVCSIEHTLQIPMSRRMQPNGKSSRSMLIL
jgi:hypothetical protein